MKNLLISIFTSVILAATAVTVAHPINSYSFGESSYEHYYDFNSDGVFNVSDLVYSFRLLDDGVLAKSDVDNVYKLVFGEEINIDFEEFDIDLMETSQNNIDYLKMISSSYLVDSESDGTCCRIRYLNDGRIIEMRCSRAADPEDSFFIPISDDIMNTICISNDKFVTRPAGYTYKTFYYDKYSGTSIGVREAIEQALNEAGKIQQADSTTLYFSNKLQKTVTKITILNDNEIVQPLETFFDGTTTIAIGFDADGRITMKQYENLSPAYCLYDLDFFDGTIEDMQNLILGSGELKKLKIVKNESHLYFGNELATTEVVISRFSNEIAEPLATFKYNGYSVKLGIDENGVAIIAIGNYSD